MAEQPRHGSRRTIHAESWAMRSELRTVNRKKHRKPRPQHQGILRRSPGHRVAAELMQIGVERHFYSRATAGQRSSADTWGKGVARYHIIGKDVGRSVARSRLEHGCIWRLTKFSLCQCRACIICHACINHHSRIASQAGTLLAQRSGMRPKH